MKSKINITPPKILGCFTLGILLLWFGSTFVLSTWVSAIIGLTGAVMMFIVLGYTGSRFIKALKRKL